MKRSKILYGLYLSQLAFLASLPDGINTEWKQRRIPTAAVNLSIYNMTAMQIEVAFVYDDIAEAGIFDALVLAKAGLIGWVQRGRNESYTYIKNPTELADFLIKKGAFDGDIIDIPSIFFTCSNNEELGNKLMNEDTLYLLETGADGFTEHIHKYESGCYYECGSRILYKID